MKRARPVVQWSPHGTNEFVVAFASDIKLYESRPPGQRESKDASNTSSAHNGFGNRTLRWERPGGERAPSDPDERYLYAEREKTRASSMTRAPKSTTTTTGTQTGANRTNGTFMPHQNELAGRGAERDESIVIPSRLKFHFKAIGVRSSSRPIRSVDWFPGTTDLRLIASGDSTGAVRLHSFDEGKRNAQPDGVVYSFIPTYGRQCNSVKWYPENPNLLVTGLDKLRNDNSIQLWDISRYVEDLATPISPQSNFLFPPSVAGQEFVSPEAFHRFGGNRQQVQQKKQTSFEAGMSEGTVAISWIPNRSCCLAAGTNFKWLRIYDVRASTSQKRPAPLSVVAHSKSVRGVCFDPCRETCLATFSDEGRIKTWDIRKLDRSIVTISTNSKTIAEISWSPVRPGHLACITMDERCISMWDVRKSSSDWSKSVSQTSDMIIGSSKEQSSSDPRMLVSETPPSSALSRSSSTASQDGDTEQNGANTGTKGSTGTVYLSKSDIRRYTSRTPASFCWIPVTSSGTWLSGKRDDFPGASGIEVGSSKETQEQLSAPSILNRVLFASWTGVLDDISLQEPLPISLSPVADLAFGLNSLVARLPYSREDPSLIAFDRAKSGYSIDVATNIKLMSSAIEALNSMVEESYEVKAQAAMRETRSSITHRKISIADRLNAIRVREMWRWVHRASDLVHPDQGKGLIDAGMISVLPRRSTTVEGQTRMEDKLKPRFRLYQSPQRTFGLALCGWRDFDSSVDSSKKLSSEEIVNEQSTSQSAKGSSSSAASAMNATVIVDGATSGSSSDAKTAKTDGPSNANNTVYSNSGSVNLKHGFVADNFMEDCLGNTSISILPNSGYHVSGVDTDYQRLSALAVFYCDLSSAVKILQDASNRLRTKNDFNNDDKVLVGGQVDQFATADLLDLVAMALAGYPDATGSGNGPKLWLETCRQLLKRLDSFPVLRAMLAFLVENFVRLHMPSEATGVNVPEPTLSVKQPSNVVPIPSSIGKQPNAELGAADTAATMGTTNGIAGTKSSSKSISKNLNSNSTSSISSKVMNLNQSSSQSDAEENNHELFSCVLDEEALSLSDRVGFACRFLPDKQLFGFLIKSTEKATDDGRLDGLILTGLGEHGLRLIQAYVDKSGDVQTAALVSCHTILNELPSHERETITRWISCYRELLNGWQLWQERAKFDCAFAEKQRQREKLQKTVPAASTPPLVSPTTPGTIDSSSSQVLETAASSLQDTDPTCEIEHGNPVDQLFSLAAKEPQLYVVCHHCKESLLLSTLFGDSLAQGLSAHVNRRKLTLPCCPRCKKKLSSCAVCVLPMTCINPHAQMTGLSQRDRSRMSRLTNASAEKHHLSGKRNHNKDLGLRRGSPSGGKLMSKQKQQQQKQQQQQPILPLSTAQPFARWFSWCLRCRHGGHAVCLTEWFSSHSRCPVSGCNCPCTNVN